jgi:peptidoglycan DL-endopeptidase CwlO
MVATCAVAVTSGLVAPRVSADQISDLKAQAVALASRIQTLGQQEEALSEQYDSAQLQVQKLQGDVAQASAQLAAAQKTANKARSALEQDAIQAYVDGGNSPLLSGSNAVQSANQTILRAEYANTVATNQSDTVDEFHAASVQEQTAENNLKKKTAAAQAEVKQLAADKRSVANSATEMNALLSQDKGRIAVLVAQQQAAAEAAARAAAQARLEAQQRAAQQAAAAQAAAAAAQQQAAQQQAQQQATPAAPATQSAPALASAPASNPTPAPAAAPVPSGGAGAAGAVQAALSRIGDPYVWGAAGPSSFDCSGLVMWAYAQVGVSLPHFSGAQYADTTHISMSDLEPGDLVFPSDPGQHVAMYVGGGMIVQAPYTGADVQEIPLSSFFVLASRVV